MEPELVVEAAQVLEMLDARSWRARSTGVVGVDRSEELFALPALISLGIPPGTSSANNACNRHAVRFRARPRSLVALRLQPQHDRMIAATDRAPDAVRATPRSRPTVRRSSRSCSTGPTQYPHP